MSYELLSSQELNVVEQTINSILGNEKFSHILHEKMIIKIKDRREEVYLINSSDLELMKNFLSLKEKGILKIIHARLKLGFFIQKKFMIGIESILFLAPLTSKKIKLSKENTEHFIYGKDVEIDYSITHNQSEMIENEAIIIVFSASNIPVGYAKLQTQEKTIRLFNLADIGMYIRSEKSAF